MEPALSVAEEEILSRQIAGLLDIDREDRVHLRNEWDKGHYCLSVRDAGLWSRLPECQGISFVDFVVAITGAPSRDVVARRIALAERYTRSQYRYYAGRGVSPEVLLAISRTPPQLRDKLLALALVGTTVSEVDLLARSAEKLRASADAPPEEGEILAHMSAELQRSRALREVERQRRKEKRRRLREMERHEAERRWASKW